MKFPFLSDYPDLFPFVLWKMDLANILFLKSFSKLFHVNEIARSLWNSHLFSINHYNMNYLRDIFDMKNIIEKDYSQPNFILYLNI